MKLLRQIGSLAFVLGLFTALFVGIPWHVIVAHHPAVASELGMFNSSPMKGDRHEKAASKVLSHASLGHFCDDLFLDC